MQYISIFSTVITIIFAGAVLRRYRSKGGAHLLLWGVGLIFYGLGTFSEAVLAFVFNGLALRIWYATGAMFTAAWLGQGESANALLVDSNSAERVIISPASGSVAVTLISRCPPSSTTCGEIEVRTGGWLTGPDAFRNAATSTWRLTEDE